ncbi:MAG: hypothetical protein LBL82_00195 [Oscillospiraceae bacterium]|jgi:hypothetical protein|nr:hypothetical protein [Oscillospiraceae bacterium]
MTARINEIIPTTYELAPINETYSGNWDFPYAVLSGINIIDLEESGDLTSFYVDVWTDNKLPTATEQLDSLCDTLRNELHNTVVAAEGKFSSHIGFENQNMIQESEFDLSHRRLSFAARIFYY